MTDKSVELKFDVDGIEIKEFKPLAFENEAMRFTEMLLEDTTTVWTMWKVTKHMGHTVELGYNNQGKLIGIRIWDLVLTDPKFKWDTEIKE